MGSACPTPPSLAPLPPAQPRKELSTATVVRLSYKIFAKYMATGYWQILCNRYTRHLSRFLPDYLCGGPRKYDALCDSLSPWGRETHLQALYTSLTPHPVTVTCKMSSNPYLGKCCTHPQCHLLSSGQSTTLSAFPGELCIFF